MICWIFYLAQLFTICWVQNFFHSECWFFHPFCCPFTSDIWGRHTTRTPKCVFNGTCLFPVTGVSDFVSSQFEIQIAPRMYGWLSDKVSLQLVLNTLSYLFYFISFCNYSIERVRAEMFWDFLQRWMVVSYKHLKPPSLSYLQRWSRLLDPLRWGWYAPEKSVRNYHFKLHKISKELISHLQYSVNLNSRIVNLCSAQILKRYLPIKQYHTLVASSECYNCS